ncbi:MAG: TRAP transporter small permease [Burkholderiaceae bacterium]|nr:TRAP transporter small permease [Burkholderiaceae bacterium]
MTLITFGQVVARYVFNYSFVWALELTTFLFAGLIFIGMSYGVRVGAHIGVDLLVKSLGPRAARVLGAIAALLCMSYAVILLVGGWQYVAKMYDVGILAQDIPIEQWIPRAVLPAGYALLLLRFTQVFLRIVTGRQIGLGLVDEAAEALAQQHEEATQPR